MYRYTKLFERFYTLNKHVLAQVDKVKYIGGIITDKLDWNDHTNSIVTKASIC